MLENKELLMDRYELEMAQTYYNEGIHEEWVVFDMFYRSVPDDGSFVIVAGLAQFIEYLKTFKFNEASLDYLKKQGYNEAFIAYLRDYTLQGTIRAVAEGTILYPNEPMVQVVAPLVEAQIIETYLLATLNFASLIATKARRIKHAAEGRTVLDFGARRAHGTQASLYGARSAFIGGVDGTSNVLAGMEYNIPISGTMAHSFVTRYDDEFEAFKVFALNNPDNAILLVDTYDTLKSGVVNAIQVQKEVLDPLGMKLKGVRLDSGDLAYLSKEARKLLDEAGMEDVLISASNSLDEDTITSLLVQDAKIDIFGVGERLITSKSSPVMGGVYKLVAVQKEGRFEPRIKLSEDTAKVITPGYKDMYRVYDEQGLAIFDLLTEQGEDVYHVISEAGFVDSDLRKAYKLRHVDKDTYTVKPLLQDVMLDGVCIYPDKSLIEIKDYVKQQLDHEIWETEQRLVNPSIHYVNYSQKLYTTKTELIQSHTLK